MNEAFAELEHSVYTALETYANVHRGSGYNAMVTTDLYEKARVVVLEFLGLNRGAYTVIFCSPWAAATLSAQLVAGSYQLVSSLDIGLSLGIRALAVKKRAVPDGIPFHTGGGTTRLMAPGWVLWAKAPGRFEAGTPAIINVIAFAKALLMIREQGNDLFTNQVCEKPENGQMLYHDEVENLSGRTLLEELRKTLVGAGALVPNLEGPKPYVNMDNAASTPAFGPVWDVARKTWRQPLPVQREVIEEVRTICAGALGAPAGCFEVIFTANTTEAINLVAGSMGNEADQGTEPVVVNTLLEHSSNDLPWRFAHHHSLVRISVDGLGLIDLRELEALLCRYNEKCLEGNRRINLVAVSGASNVLGICNDLDEIAGIVHRYGAKLLVDGAQLVAHRKVDMEKSGIDFLAFSAHKVYAPFGCGVLVAKRDLLHFSPEEMQLIRSSGEENAGGIAALGKALLLLQRVGFEVIRAEEQALTRRLLTGMAGIPGLTVFGVKDPDSPCFARKLGVVAFSLKGSMPGSLASELALRSGIGVRYGCHCAHLLVKHLLGVGAGLERFQRVLLTLFPNISLPGVARVSLGIGNTAGEVDLLLETLNRIAVKPRSPGDTRAASKQKGTAVLERGNVKRQLRDMISKASLRVYSHD
ncbi:MAG: aminotransferase class V-fold PLP-dependent enzyme [Bacteroidota bacterium]